MNRSRFLRAPKITQQQALNRNLCSFSFSVEAAASSTKDPSPLLQGFNILGIKIFSFVLFHPRTQDNLMFKRGISLPIAHLRWSEYLELVSILRLWTENEIFEKCMQLHAVVRFSDGGEQKLQIIYVDSGISI